MSTFPNSNPLPDGSVTRAKLGVGGIVALTQSDEGILAANTTRFIPFTGGGFTASETPAEMTAPHSGRVKLIRVRTNANTLDVALTIKFRKNFANQGVGVVIAAGVVEFRDSIEVLEFAKGNTISFTSIIPAGAGSVTVHFLAELEFDND